ncbi:hypothetical protein QQF64_020106 [Cirrhinus molitorella]|uniref:Uncharacterized protein n=1 Tax=Cirrhinus molitorella TaxID=172907 RepID=A0ABR3LJ20_9TELE
MRNQPAKETKALPSYRPANIGEDILPTLSREDIRDLFPGPEHFRRRKAIWLLTHKEEQGHSIPGEIQISSADDDHAQSLKQDDPSTSKFLKLPSPEYVLFTDSELQHVRRTYFEQQRLGKEGDVTLSKELFCRLIRNTMTNMISIARASSDDYKYPTKHEVIAMARRLVEYYPMIKDKSTGSRHEWDTVAKKLLKRLSNIRSPMKAKQPPSKRARQDREPSAAVASDYDADSSASTVNLSPPSRSSTPQQENDSISEASDGPDNSLDSQKAQARHYRTLQEMYKAKKPNKAAVTHLLDLEFQSRRNFIDSNALKEQDKPTQILQAYPCFKELNHVGTLVHWCRRELEKKMKVRKPVSEVVELRWLERFPGAGEQMSGEHGTQEGFGDKETQSRSRHRFLERVWTLVCLPCGIPDNE